MRIYTKTGDGGESSLYTGRRAPKDQAVFEALGDVDEANCAVGSARTAVLEAARGRRREEVGSQEDTSEAPAALAELAEQLSVVQSRLLDVGSAVATPLGEASEYKAARAAFSDGQAAVLEGWIDALDARLPPLVTFILPGGGVAAAALHMARGVCRRAERRVVTLAREGKVEEAVGVYLNRLSDYLFTAARAAAQDCGEEELTYQKPKQG